MSQALEQRLYRAGVRTQRRKQRTEGITIDDQPAELTNRRITFRTVVEYSNGLTEFLVAPRLCDNVEAVVGLD